MYTLYTLEHSASTAITAFMEKNTIAYQLKDAEFVDNYISINQSRTVPALQIDETTTLQESLAIGLYLYEKHAPDLLPQTPEGKAQFIDALAFNSATLHPAYSRLFSVLIHTPFQHQDFTDETLSEEKAEKNIILQNFVQRVKRHWRTVEKRLKGKHFIMGDTPTLMDYQLAIYSHWTDEYPNIDFQIGDTILCYAETVRELPEFQAALAAEKKAAATQN